MSNAKATATETLAALRAETTSPLCGPEDAGRSPEFFAAVMRAGEMLAEYRDGYADAFAPVVLDALRVIHDNGLAEATVVRDGTRYTVRADGQFHPPVPVVS